MKLKIASALSLIVFFVFMTSVFTAGIVGYYKQNDLKQKLSKQQNDNDSLANFEGDLSLVGALTSEEVAKHSSAADCWLLIDGNVYDVTSFVNSHPGGSIFITNHCGKESTDAFDTRDRNPKESHSNFARDLLRSYYIGPFGRMPENILYPDPNNPGNILSRPFAGVTPGFSIPSGQLQGTGSSMLIDSTEVAKHATLQNCWMIISGNVYDITNFSASHPGGASAIASYCGKDGTSAYKNKGGQGNDHSSYAYNLLNNYLIAKLGSTVTTTSSGSGSGAVIPIVSQQTGTTGNTPTQAPVSNSNLSLTTSEISTHNTLQNCWLIVSGSVYDVTKYISQHPGGISQITNWCGKDGTSAYQTKGGRGGNHSSYAYGLLSNYLIGTVGSTVSVNATPVPTQTSGSGSTSPAATTSPSSSGGSSLPSAILSKYPSATYISGKYEDNGSWEGTINTGSGCRHIKVSSSGSISEEESC